MEETKLLLKELESFKTEQERVRALVGRIGGRTSLQQDTIINIVFLLIVLTVFLFDVLRGIFGITVPGMPLALMEETALLLISLKIIWMIHKQTKIDHFQFWILTSIEYQLTEVAKKVKDLEARIDGRTAGGK
jgi:hypothetical protein